MRFIADKDSFEPKNITEAYRKSGFAVWHVEYTVIDFGNIQGTHEVAKPQEFFYWCMENGYRDRLPTKLRRWLLLEYPEWKRKDKQKELVEQSNGRLQYNCEIGIALAELKTLLDNNYTPLMGTDNKYITGRREDASPEVCNYYSPDIRNYWHEGSDYPPALFHTFHFDSRATDFRNMAYLDTWSLKEALPILLGFHSSKLQFVFARVYAPEAWEELTTLQAKDKEAVSFFALTFTEKLNGLLAVAKDASLVGKLPILTEWNAFETKVRPSEFCRWAKAKGYNLPAELECLLDAPAPTPPAAAQAPAADVSPPAREELAKQAEGVAVTVEKGRKPRKTVSQETMAEMCYVTLSAVKKWESKKGTPPDTYPGRDDLALAQQFAERYRSKKVVNRQGRALRKARTGHNLDSFGDDESME